MTRQSAATLSADFKLEIPEAVREAQGWKAGQKFAFVPTGHGGVELVRVPTVEEMHGMFKGADTSDIRDHTDRY